MNLSPACARRHLVPLWLAVFARFLGAAAVGTCAFLQLDAGLFRGDPATLVALCICLMAVPKLILAPLIGAVVSSPQRQRVMIVGLLVGLAVIGYCAFKNGPWFSCLGVLGVEGAFFAAGRMTLVPIGARAARLSLPRLHEWMMVAVGGGTLLGVVIGLSHGVARPTDSLPHPVVAGLIGYAVAALAMLLVPFRGEGDTPLSAGLARPFAAAFREIARTRNARNTFLALGGWLLLALLYAHEHRWLVHPNSLYPFGPALVIGFMVGGFNAHAYRTLGLVPYAMLGLFGIALYNTLSGNWASPVWASGILLGATLVPLLTVFQASLYPRSWGHGSAILFAWFAVIACAFAGLLLSFRSDPARFAEIIHSLRFGLVALLTLFSLLVFLRPMIELTTEVVLWPIHRIKKVGPGYDSMPWKGPCLVIANHGAMLDPLWISKYLPIPTTPMMTSKFYDLPVISWLMRKVVGTIRVPDALVRREAPEIKEAIAALDRNECVVIFPEGWLRRKDEVPLRRFGRGVWQILKERPDTPVFAFWIENNWGSFFSWKGGGLMKGKPFDFWRTITIAGVEGRKVRPDLLASHLTTRAELMRWVLEARALLGLPPIESVSIPGEGHDDEEKEGA